MNFLSPVGVHPLLELTHHALNITSCFMVFGGKRTMPFPLQNRPGKLRRRLATAEKVFSPSQIAKESLSSWAATYSRSSIIAAVSTNRFNSFNEALSNLACHVMKNSPASSLPARLALVLNMGSMASTSKPKALPSSFLAALSLGHS